MQTPFARQLQGCKRANDTNSADTPVHKYPKSDCARWRSYESSPGIDAPSLMIDPNRAPAHAEESTPTSTEPSDPYSAPSQSKYFGFISEALTAHPGGLRTQEIIAWLEGNRPDAFLDRNKDKLKTSIQTTLSAQANRKEPRIWRYRQPGSRGAGYIWTLCSTVTEVEQAPVTLAAHATSPMGDSVIVRSIRDETQAPLLSKAPEGSSRETRDSSVASALLHLHMRNGEDPVTDTRNEASFSSGPGHDMADDQGEEAQTVNPSSSSAISRPRPAEIGDDGNVPLQIVKSGVPPDAVAVADKDLTPPLNLVTSTNRASEVIDAIPTPQKVNTEGTGTFVSDVPRRPSETPDTLGDHDERYLGSLVSKIHRLRRQRETTQREIQAKREISNQVEVYERRASDLLRSAEDLDRQAQYARERANLAREDAGKVRSEQEQNEADIALADSKLAQLEREEIEAREGLGID
ncbi:hypothetical protein LTS00_018000 [Friedmanniomyces endolithicus]|nr:hypothetical protein LTS00_018000 [Friedmanniomyces endolithicus]